jgi:hypothetical protein
MIYSFNSFINEAKQIGLLYHWTSFAGVYMILEQNYLKGANRTIRNDVKTINRADEYGVSFTRDKTFYKDNSKFYPMEVCIVIDGDKLSNNYKLFPYNDFYEGEDKPNYKGAKESDEMETRTNRSIEKIINYIIRVELYDNTSGASEKEQLDFIKWFAPYKNVYKGFNVNGYTSIDEFKKELCEYVQSKGIECVIKA